MTFASGPLSGPSRRWRGDSPILLPLREVPARALANVAFSPVVTDQMALVMLRSGDLIALDIATGAARWRSHEPGPVELVSPFGGAPLVESTKVWTRTGTQLSALDLHAGTPLERRKAPPLDLLSGLYVRGCIVSHVSNGDAGIVAWEVDTASVLWSHHQRFSPVPLAADPRAIFAADGDRVRALDVLDGSMIWEVDCEDIAIGSLAVAPDGSLLIALSHRILCLDGGTGALRWRTDTPVARTSTMALTDDGEIHLLDLQRYMRLSSGDGSVLLDRELPRETLPRLRGSLGRLSASRSHVFACDLRGPVIAVSRLTGAVEWVHPEALPHAAQDAPVLTASGLFTLGLNGALQWFAPAET